MNMDILITSVDQPQLDKCLESVKNQTVPFHKVVHINNVVPEIKAFQEGLKEISSKWFMRIGGDFVLYDNAVEMVSKRIGKYSRLLKLGVGTFALHDLFLDLIICGCSVYNTEAVRSIRLKNNLRSDIWIDQYLRRKGWGTYKWCKTRGVMVVGTHFDNPTDFQIFTRFYAQGVKDNIGWISNFTKKLNGSADDSKYLLAIKAIEYGRENIIT